MGLDPAEQNATRRGRCWRIPALLLVAAVLVAAMGDAGREALRYERALVADGEWWRLLSAHVTHLGWRHVALNAAGIVLVWLLVGRALTRTGWALVLAVGVAVIDAAFWLLRPDLGWYVGLSGLLHAVLVAGLVTGWRAAPRETLLIAIVVVAKLGYEQFGGALPGSQSMSGGPVVVDAHLYGAVGGIVGGLAAIRFRREAPL